jgi:EAL domain-containing protein (putative c-di-GMP-specific phosphodiesterase class I)
VLALRDPFGVEGREVFIHASIGIAFAAEDATSELLLRNADLAMYTAKRQGKDRYAIYQSDMHIAALGRLDLEADLRRGLAKGDLTVYYQPIVTMATGAIVGTEALVRWEHPVRGFLSPDSFIPIAEETGLVVELGRQVLLAACTQTRAWQREHGNDGLYVSVNLSARQLQDPDLVEDVRRCLRESGLAARSLVLEITETAMMQDTDRAIAALTELKALGLQLAVDDFGTGYSSLSYLQRFPVDLLKIDRSFVSDIDATEAEASFAHTILTLAGTLHLTAVAEGVETALQANVLQRMGCELAQGYHYARPMPAPKLRTLLQAANLPRVATTSSPIEVAVAP